MALSIRLQERCGRAAMRPARCKGLQPSSLMPWSVGRAAKRFDGSKAQAKTAQRAGLLSRQERCQVIAATLATPNPHKPHPEYRRDSARRRPNAPRAFPARLSRWHCEYKARKTPNQGPLHPAGAQPMPAQKPALAIQAHKRPSSQICAASPYARSYARYTPTTPTAQNLITNHGRSKHPFCMDHGCAFAPSARSFDKPSLGAALLASDRATASAAG
jgi:hypothetical protein